MRNPVLILKEFLLLRGEVTNTFLNILVDGVIRKVTSSLSEKKLAILNFGLVLVMLVSILPTSVLALPQKENGDFVTNKLTAEIDLYAERFSDIEIFIRRDMRRDNRSIVPIPVPDESVPTQVKQADSNGKVKFNIPLGTQTDERDGCVETKHNRRTGICEDGIFTVDTFSYDAAGNKSEKSVINIERDTVAPSAPNIIRLEVCGNNICALVESEPFSYLYTNGRSTSQVTTYRSYVVIQYGWEHDKLYTFRFKSVDLAENQSAEVTKTILTPSLLAYRGAIDGANSENPYADYSLDNFDEVKFKVNLNTLDGSYKITEYEIPAPVLTMIFTDYDNTIDIYGIGINKNWKGKAEVNKIFPSYSEARKKCGTGILSGFDGNSCILETMQLTQGELWQIADEECRSIFGHGTVRCLFGNEDNLRRNPELKNVEFAIKNVSISFHNESKEDNYVGSTWNDAEDGKFQKSLKLSDDLKEFDNLRSRVSIFGDFDVDGQQINYRGIDNSKANENYGLWSGFSNSLQIDKSEYISLNEKKAKVLNVPYFNQWLEPDGSNNPPDGWQMCGAASAVMVAGYFGKLEYKNDHDLKKYMYSDSGQGLENPCNDENKAGAFGVTQLGCEMNYAGGIQQYLQKKGIETHPFESFNYYKIKESIDRGNPVIFSYSDDYGFSHIAVVVGYTLSDEIVVNDSYTNTALNGKNWKGYNDGKFAVYPVANPDFYYGYNIFIK